MNKKIKIIDIFNIISKKDYEALPLSIEVDGKKYNWDTMEHFYAREDKNREDLLELATIYDTVTFLDMNVEILEDSTEEIEELDRLEIRPYKGIDYNFELIENKINKLVKVIKEIRKDLNK